MIGVVDVAVVVVVVVVVAALYSVRKTFLGQKSGWLKSCRERKKKNKEQCFNRQFIFT